MKTKQCMASLLLLMGLATLGQAACAQALTKGSASKGAASLTQSYTWYEGGAAQQVWLHPGIMAEFGPSVRGAEAVRKASADAAVLSENMRNVRLWKFTSSNVATAVKALTVSYPNGSFSPVFYENANGGGRMRALPGNVIVSLDAKWNKAAVDTWLAKRNLSAISKLNVGGNVYVIKTGPGLDALNLANTLQQSGEVISATPDWWQEVATR